MSPRHHDPSGDAATRRPRGTEPVRQRRWRKVALATAIALGVGAPAAGALWYAVVYVKADDISRGQIGFRLTQWDSAHTQVQDVAATDFETPPAFAVTLTEADAAAILGSPPAHPATPTAMAIPIRVESLAEGNGGLRYSFTDIGSLPAGDLLTWDFYLVGEGLNEADGLAACTTDVAAAGSGYTPYVPGDPEDPVSPVPSDDAVVSDWWCLVVSYDPGHDVPYTNTAADSAQGCTGIGPDEDGPCRSGDWAVPAASATWSATVRPTPNGQPNITIPLTYVIIRPGG